MLQKLTNARTVQAIFMQIKSKGTYEYFTDFSPTFV